jgi:hypothetical protein
MDTCVYWALPGESDRLWCLLFNLALILAQKMLEVVVSCMVIGKPVSPKAPSHAALAAR